SIALPLHLIHSPVHINAVELAFTSKPSAGPFHELLVQWRKMVNGYPSRDVIATKVYKPDQITVQAITDPDTGGPGWAPTRFEFAPWVVLNPGEQLALSLLARVPDYRVLTATLGANDSVGRQISDNPYGLGDLFFSSTGATWAPDLRRDLWMKVYCK